MYNFDPYNVLLAIATNIPPRPKTAFVLQAHIFTQVHSDDALNPSVLLEQVCIAHEKRSRAALRNTFSVRGIIDYNQFYLHLM